ncbi:hypothetical protein [Rhabdothermincola salaria]|uniref:hypothetical protein n=1 Tax=Rhabdothermincola salaria TaxID=2903142 RepID=UPI001E3C5DB0|nr:hypothetical protein [Rhabdothermincola salaria]MCD9623229.1 hypothetical protein [Rhabdothermincola salaria]
MTATRRLRYLALGLAASATITACGASSSTSDAPGGDLPDETRQAIERLTGRYAHFDVVAYESSDMKTLIISYGFTDLSAEGTTLVAEDSFCSSEHRSDQPIEVQLSDTATQAIRPVPTPVTLTVADGRARVSRPETPTGIGVDLEDPANDPLPTDPADPRIADDDGDGKPGVTATITVSEALGGELYLARREIFSYVVEERDDGSLVGSVSDRSEQLVIGASDEAFVTQAAWVQHEDLSKSPIILIPVEPDWDCARLTSERDRLFPPTPEVDW